MDSASNAGIQRIPLTFQNQPPGITITTVNIYKYFCNDYIPEVNAVHKLSYKINYLEF